MVHFYIESNFDLLFLAVSGLQCLFKNDDHTLYNFNAPITNLGTILNIRIFLV